MILPFIADAQGQTTVLVCCEGVVRYDGHSNEQCFTQNFLLVKQADVWKVGSDSKRVIHFATC